MGLGKGISLGVTFVKRMLLFFFVILEALVFLGCNNQNTYFTMEEYESTPYEVNNYSDAAMVIVEDSVTNTGLTLKLYYYGEDEGTTGTWYTLFVFNGSEWEELPDIADGNVAWYSIAYVVEKNHPCELKINWEWLFGELPPGRYLVVKEFHNSRGPGDYDEYNLACEFTTQ